MAKNKKKKHILKAQLELLKQEAIDLRHSKKTREQVEHDKTYWKLKDEEKLVEFRFNNKTQLSDRDVESLSTPMNARYVKAHSVACANRINMMREWSMKKQRQIKAQEKHIAVLTEQLKKQKQPNKLVRIIKKWKEI